MIKVETSISGIKPLAVDKLDIERIIKPEPNPKKYTEEILAHQAELSLYRNHDGLFIPNRNLKKCFIQGAKMGRITLGGRRNLYPFIEASVFISPDEIPLNKEEPDNFYQFAMRRKDGNVIPKRLPIFTDWQLDFTLSIFDDEITDKVQEAITIAGLSVGIGACRPEFGRFEISKWEVNK